jgi:hypothetical protein
MIAPTASEEDSSPLPDDNAEARKTPLINDGTKATMGKASKSKKMGSGLAILQFV